MKTTKKVVPSRGNGAKSPHAGPRAAVQRATASAHAAQSSLSEGLNRATHDKILAGAVIAVSRQGTKKLAMGDICDVAGVSRGTLYRYFATKDEVLHAMGEYISLSFENGVVEIAAQHTDPVDILRAVLEFHFSQTRKSDRVLEIEPTYVMGFLRDHFPRHVAAMKTALAAVFEYVEREAGVPVDEDLIAQLLIRIELSTLLVPGDPVWNKVPEMLSALLQSFVELARAGQARSARATRRAST
jgi:AcrR family transcriptional regulator